MDDAILIARMKEGSKEAFGEFINKYYTDISRYCCARCLDVRDAEDITQETFLHFFEDLSHYEHRGKAKNFLYTTAGNLIRNRIKQRKEVALDNETLGDLPEMTSGDETITLVEKLYLEEMLRFLSPTYKEVIELFYFQGLTLKEISDRLDIGLPLVKYRLKRARELMKEKMKFEG